MDEIPFTKVTLEEAKAAMQSDAIHTRTVAAPAPDWKRQRNPAPLPNLELSLTAFKWLAALPAKVRPHGLARHYPRIVNRLAEIWHRPLQCEAYLDELMMDKRGSRRGFPPEVAAEIAALKVHFIATANTVHFGVWGNRIGVD